MAVAPTSQSYRSMVWAHAQNQVKYVVDKVAGIDRRRVKLRSGRTLNADILVVARAPLEQ